MYRATSRKPTAPAARPALRASRPRVADTASDDSWRSCTGSEPYLRPVARLLAVSSSKLPLISMRSASKLGALMLGAESTRPSSVMAICFVGHSAAPWKHLAARALNLSMPSAPPLNTGFTVHLPLVVLMLAEAPSSAAPVRQLPAWVGG